LEAKLSIDAFSTLRDFLFWMAENIYQAAKPEQESEEFLN
jgi:hypothetical protein